MAAMKVPLIVFNLLIWVFGAALTGLGIWIKTDKEFRNIQTKLDMTQFGTSANILVAAGVFIMVVGLLGCYCAVFTLSLWIVAVYGVFCIVIIVLEITVMVLVWAPINNKEVINEIKAKMEEAMQEETERYFLDLLQLKLECCGIDGPDDYKGNKSEGIPGSCIGPTGYPQQEGCLEAVIKYFKAYAGILGGVAVAAFVLHVAALGLTLFLALVICSIDENDLEDARRVACVIKNSALTPLSVM